MTLNFSRTSQVCANSKVMIQWLTMPDIYRKYADIFLIEIKNVQIYHSQEYLVCNIDSLKHG